jgi:hypothetical protein
MSMESASAVEAGVNRRAHRRAYRRDYYGDGHTEILIAVTIQRTSVSATTDSGGTTDTPTYRGGHAEAQAWAASYVVG